MEEEYNTKKLYRFTWDWGRMGILTGIFAAEEKEIKELIGKELDFDEALGKHSEVDGILQKEEIELLSDDPSFVKIFIKKKMDTGYNPLLYCREAEEE